MLRIHVRAAVKPTEDPAKVRRAIESLFPGVQVEDREGWLYAEAANLARLKELVRSEQIQDTARGVMRAGLTDDGMQTTFRLGKQAAAAGRAHFGPLRSPLGDLEVTVTGTEPHEVERLLFHVAPDTTVPPEWAEIPEALRPKDALDA